MAERLKDTGNGLGVATDSLRRDAGGGSGGCGAAPPRSMTPAVELAAVRLRGEPAPGPEELARAAEVTRG